MPHFFGFVYGEEGAGGCCGSNSDPDPGRLELELRYLPPLHLLVPLKSLFTLLVTPPTTPAPPAPQPQLPPALQDQGWNQSWRVGSSKG